MPEELPPAVAYACGPFGKTGRWDNVGDLAEALAAAAASVVAAAFAAAGLPPVAFACCCAVADLRHDAEAFSLPEACGRTRVWSTLQVLAQHAGQAVLGGQRQMI